MRIRDSRKQVPGLDRPRSRAVTWCAVSVCLALLVLFGLWRPGGVPVAALFSLVLGLAALVDMAGHRCGASAWPAGRGRKPPYAGKGSQRRYRAVLAVPRRLRQPLISVRSGGATCSMRSRSTGASAPKHAQPRPRSPGTGRGESTRPPLRAHFRAFPHRGR